MVSKLQDSGEGCFLLRRYLFPGRIGSGVRPPEYRFSPETEKLQNWPQWAPVARRLLVMLGAAHSGHEIRNFQIKMEKIQPPISVLVTPSEVVLTSVSYPLRPQHFWIDS